MDVIEVARTTLRVTVMSACMVMAGASPLAAADGPPDAWLTTTTKIAILTSIGVPGTTVQVDTRNATITLYGKVSSAADSTLVEKIARSTKGVREVRNLLLVASVTEAIGTAPPDSDLHSAVAVALIVAALTRDSPLGGGTVFVESVDKGTVVLSGTASLMAHLRAIEAARSVHGVRAVRSRIAVADTSAVSRAVFLAP